MPDINVDVLNIKPEGVDVSKLNLKYFVSFVIPYQPQAIAKPGIPIVPLPEFYSMEVDTDEAFDLTSMTLFISNAIQKPIVILFVARMPI